MRIKIYMSDNEENKENLEIEDFCEIPKTKPKWRRWFFSFWIFILVAVLAGAGSLLVYKTGFTFSQMQVDEIPAGILPLSEHTPMPEADRLNILLLGLRGENDDNGGLLTDSIMVVSLKKSTGQAALISIPRDLYVKMPGEDYKEKINYAHALGYEKRGAAGGLLYSKIVVSKATGLYLNHAIAVNHQAFKEIVDILDGVDIYLDKPFSEKTQFAKEILIDMPAGQNHLNGATALYFVRSRFSTSDFDRARRQQLVLLAIKNKIISLKLLTNPVKIFQILESLGRNVKTDLGLSEIKNLIDLSQKLNDKNIIHKVFDTTPEGLLYSAHAEKGAYILLPVSDNFDKIHEACRNIFE